MHLECISWASKNRKISSLCVCTETMGGFNRKTPYRIRVVMGLDLVVLSATDSFALCRQKKKHIATTWKKPDQNKNISIFLNSGVTLYFKIWRLASEYFFFELNYRMVKWQNATCRWTGNQQTSHTESSYRYICRIYLDYFWLNSINNCLVGYVCNMATPVNHGWHLHTPFSSQKPFTMTHLSINIGRREGFFHRCLSTRDLLSYWFLHK